MKTRIIKATASDLAYIAHRRDLLTLERLAKNMGRIDQLLVRLPAEKPDILPKDFLKTLREQRAAIQARVRKYQTVNRRRKRNFARHKNQVAQNLAALPKYFAQFTQWQQTTGDRYRQILGENGNCQIIHGIVNQPSNFHVFEETKTYTSGSRISFVKDESSTDMENVLIVNGEVFGDECLLADPFEFGFCLLIHQYDIPAPACDSIVHWRVNFALSLNEELFSVEDKGDIKVGPVLMASPTGSIPTLTEFAEAEFFGLRIHRTLDNSDSSAPERPVDWPFDLTHSASYEVRAGVTSKIFFGVSLAIGAQDGLVSGIGAAWLTHPPGATPCNPSKNPTCNPQVPPPFFPPIPGVQYLIWPKSMLPKCYITTAICNVLGKPDDCYELNLLRRFRDTYVAKLPEGNALITEYYTQAPQILVGILDRADRNEQLRALYERFLLPCVRGIETGRHATALATYKQMVVFAAELTDSGATIS